MQTQNDPFRLFDSLLDQFGTVRNTGGNVAVDAYRRGEDVWLHFDLPGVAADSLDIDIERNVLTVSAERKWRSEEGDQMYFSERRQGKFRRQVALGQELDIEAIEADYHDGVLTVRIPVAERAKPRKVAINTGSQEAVETHEIEGSDA
ncbi:MAG: Hsp20/alpha crystallin family protein [Acidimicrobiales bacterium]